MFNDGLLKYMYNWLREWFRTQGVKTVVSNREQTYK